MPKQYTVEEWKKKLFEIENNHVYDEERLDFGGRSLDKQKIVELIIALQNNYKNHVAKKDLHCITWIDFNDCGLDDGLIEILGNGLQSTANIVKINLTNNKIKDTKCLIGFLKLENLTEIRLTQNQINDSNLISLAKGLGDQNCHLKSLDLGYNEIGNANSVNLILARNTSLDYIDLSNNVFSEITMQCLIEGLNINKTIKRMNLDNCEINDNDIAIFHEKITETSLEKLYMCDNDSITEDGKKLLQEISKNNFPLEIYIWNGEKVSLPEDEITMSMSNFSMTP